MARFVVRERGEVAGADDEFVVLDREDHDRPVAEFADRASAEAHAARLERGPFDWDEQEQWKDEWDDEDD